MATIAGTSLSAAAAGERPDISSGFKTMTLTRPSASTVLAVGAELKSMACLHRAYQVTMTAESGPLTQPDVYRAFVAAVAALRQQSDTPIDVVAHDLHPQYLSTRLAQSLGLPCYAVQHHHAHVASVIAEAGLTEQVIGVACDGVGYGSDGAAWGCEIIQCDLRSFKRIGHLRYFPLVGGDAAAIDTWRPAAALLAQAEGDVRSTPNDNGKSRGSFVNPSAHARPRLDALLSDLADEDQRVFRRMLDGNVNAPLSSSLGRVFDAASFVLGLCRRNTFEAEAAIALDSVASTDVVRPYPYEIANGNGGFVLSLAPTIAAAAADRQEGSDVSLAAARFHETLAQALAESAIRAAQRADIETVVLAGGCFANRRLRERLSSLLERRGFRVETNRALPYGDAGISVGQAVIAAAALAR